MHEAIVAILKEEGIHAIHTKRALYQSFDIYTGGHISHVLHQDGTTLKLIDIWDGHCTHKYDLADPETFKQLAQTIKSHHAAYNARHAEQTGHNRWTQTKKTSSKPSSQKTASPANHSTGTTASAPTTPSTSSTTKASTATSSTSKTGTTSN